MWVWYPTGLELGISLILQLLYQLRNLVAEISDDRTFHTPSRPKRAQKQAGCIQDLQLLLQAMYFVFDGSLVELPEGHGVNCVFVQSLS